MKIPNEKKIIQYATECGLKNCEISFHDAFGYSLHGEGRASPCDDHPFDRPLVWNVSENCGISWGGGGPTSHQIKPELFKEPL